MGILFIVSELKQDVGTLSDGKQQSLMYLIKSCGKHDDINENEIANAINKTLGKGISRGTCHNYKGRPCDKGVFPTPKVTINDATEKWNAF